VRAAVFSRNGAATHACHNRTHDEAPGATFSTR